MHHVGLRSHYVASAACARMPIERRGLIVTISSFGTRSFQLSTAYGVGRQVVTSWHGVWQRNSNRAASALSRSTPGSSGRSAFSPSKTSFLSTSQRVSRRSSPVASWPRSWAATRGSVRVVAELADVHVLTQHIMVSIRASKLVARVLMGMDTDTFQL